MTDAERAIEEAERIIRRAAERIPVPVRRPPNRTSPTEQPGQHRAEGHRLP